MPNSSWSNLLIQTIADPATFVLFDDARKVIAQEQVTLKGKEFDLLLPSVEAFLAKHGTSTKALSSLVLVNGPASFTGGRIASLTANTLGFANGTKLHAIDFFEYCRLGGWSFPMLLEANREESILKRSAESEMELVKNDSLEPGNYAGFITLPNFAERKIRVQSESNADALVRWLDLSHPVERIETLYLKRPNITFSTKKHGSPGTSTEHQ